jgi:hypothetical protein
MRALVILAILVSLALFACRSSVQAEIPSEVEETPTVAPTPTAVPTATLVPTPTPTIIPAPTLTVSKPRAQAVFHADFETPTVGEEWQLFQEGDSLDGCRVEGTVDLTGTFWEAASGLQSLDLHGFKAGALTCEVPVEAGKTYEVCFALSGNIDGGTSPKVVEVWVGSVLADRFEIDMAARSQSYMGWVYRGYSFVANNRVITLRFVGAGGGSHWGPVVDDIIVFVGTGNCQGEVRLIELPTPLILPDPIVITGYSVAPD